VPEVTSISGDPAHLLSQGTSPFAQLCLRWPASAVMLLTCSHRAPHPLFSCSLAGGLWVEAQRESSCGVVQ